MGNIDIWAFPADCHKEHIQNKESNERATLYIFRSCLDKEHSYNCFLVRLSEKSIDKMVDGTSNVVRHMLTTHLLRVMALHCRGPHSAYCLKCLFNRFHAYSFIVHKLCVHRLPLPLNGYMHHEESDTTDRAYLAPT